MGKKEMILWIVIICLCIFSGYLIRENVIYEQQLEGIEQETNRFGGVLLREDCISEEVTTRYQRLVNIILDAKE